MIGFQVRLDGVGLIDREDARDYQVPDDARCVDGDKLRVKAAEDLRGPLVVGRKRMRFHNRQCRRGTLSDERLTPDLKRFVLPPRRSSQ